MDLPQVFLSVSSLFVVVLMAMAALLTRFTRVSVAELWRIFQTLSAGAVLLAGVCLWVRPSGLQPLAAVQASSFGLYMALLVQVLGTVIGGFSARYLQGEDGQRRYVTALATALAGVHLLLLANHWVVLISAWALVGAALQHMLCFYPQRPFARLAAQKKQIADRLADALLVGAAALAWVEVGSGYLSDLWAHLAREGISTPLQFSAAGLVLAVILRSALLPVHGWLIQVMEAPTPVSAFLHAGVVNLGGFVLIGFAPLLEQAMPARVLLVVFGLTTAVLAGMVMLTRISIKVRLAWSTVAQMGFMLLECGLGLYTLAGVHLIGHSLYKAHAFLSASEAVSQTRIQALHSRSSPTVINLVFAPVLTISAMLLIQSIFGHTAWPWWWNAVLGLAWAPLIWLPAAHVGLARRGLQAAVGLLMVAGLTGAVLLAHALPLGIEDAPHDALGLIAIAGMLALYLCLALLQLRPQALKNWWRWSYAGFYVDEAYTRLALQLWPARWMPEPQSSRIAAG